MKSRFVHYIELLAKARVELQSAIIATANMLVIFDITPDLTGDQVASINTFLVVWIYFALTLRYIDEQNGKHKIEG